VQFAIKGGSEARRTLIRDSSKVVQRAVLQSPRLTDQEVEAFASMTSLTDEILRLIATNRNFRKNYTVVPQNAAGREPAHAADVECTGSEEAHDEQEHSGNAPEYVTEVAAYAQGIAEITSPAQNPIRVSVLDCFKFVVESSEFTVRIRVRRERPAVPLLAVR
jgi:hypothetical protein